MNDITLYLQTDKEKFLVWCDKLVEDNIERPKIYESFTIAWPLFFIEQDVYTLRAKIPQPIEPEQPLQDFEEELIQRGFTKREPINEPFELVDMISLELTEGTERGLKVIISYSMDTAFLPPLFDLLDAIGEDWQSIQADVDSLRDELGIEKPPRPPETPKPKSKPKGRGHIDYDLKAHNQIFVENMDPEEVKELWLEDLRKDAKRRTIEQKSKQKAWRRLTKRDWSE